MDQFRNLESVLPNLPGTFQLNHIKARTKKCRRLVYRPSPKGTKTNSKGKPQETDLVTTHLLILSYDGLDIYALEAFIYESENNGKSVYTLFISKADTTGHYYQDASKYKISISKITTEIIRGLLKNFVNNSPPSSSDSPGRSPPELVRVCLFAKAEKQYLFPLSSENPKKHVLWDSSLVKWWCKVLEPLKDEFADLQKARLQIPGSDAKSISMCFPKSDDDLQPHLPWQVGDVYYPDDGSNDGLAAVRCIPRFPDDPKTRFLEYLVTEKRAKKVLRDQFWLELQARQEFRLGSVVGIIGLEGTPNRSSSTTSTGGTAYGIPNKQHKKIRDLLVSLDFSSEEAARDSHKLLEERIPQLCKLQLKGKFVGGGPEKVSKATPEVNVLNASFVRKKPKK